MPMPKTRTIETLSASVENPEDRQAQAARAIKRRRKRRPHSTSVNVTFRRLEPSPAIQSYAERKLGNINKFLKKDAAVHLVLSVDKYRHCGEATVKAGSLNLKAAHEEGHDLYAVIDGLADKVKRQLTEQLNKIKQSRIRPAPLSAAAAPQQSGAGEAKSE